MMVKIGEKIWEVSRKRYESILAVGKEQVSFGVYAIEKDGQAEIRHDHCKSITQLKALTRQFKSQGFKVYANGR